MSTARDIADSAATINFIDGVTSDVQTQLDAKATYPSQTGNAGKYLTTDGSATSWGTVSGTTQFADTPLTISAYHDITKDVVEALKIDDDRDLLILGSFGSTTDCIGIVYNHSTDTWGTETTIRTPSVVYFGAIKIDTDKFLVVTSQENTSIFAKVITISGTTITVGAETTITVVDSHGNAPNGYYGHGLFNCGTSYVLTYPQLSSATCSQMAVAMTVSGTTVTAGSEVTIESSAQNMWAVSPASGYILFATNDGSWFNFNSYSVSGTTLSFINKAQTVNNLTTYYEYGYLGKTSGNHYLFWQNTSSRTSLEVATFDASYNVTLTEHTPFLGDDIAFDWNKWVIFDDSNNAIVATGDAGPVWYNIYYGNTTSIGTQGLSIFNANYFHGNDSAIYVRSNYFAQKIDFDAGDIRRTNLQNNFATTVGDNPRINTKSNGFTGSSGGQFYNDTRLLITNSQYMYNVKTSSSGQPANSILSADDKVVLHPLDAGTDNKIPLVSDTGIVNNVKYTTGFENTTAQYRVARMTMS